MSPDNIIFIGVVLGVAIFAAYGLGWMNGYKEAYAKANKALDDFIAEQGDR